MEEAAAVAPQGAAIASKGAGHNKLGSFQRLDALEDYLLVLHFLATGRANTAKKKVRPIEKRSSPC